LGIILSNNGIKYGKRRIDKILKSVNLDRKHSQNWLIYLTIP